MKKTLRSLIMAGGVVLPLTFLCSNAPAKLAVELLADPDIKSIPLAAGSPNITITTRTNQEQVRFTWSLIGPGTLAGRLTASGIVYIPPANQEDKKGQATIAVTITNATGENAVEQLTFTLSPPMFPRCQAETKPLEEVQKMLPEYLQQYTALKAEEKQGGQRNKEMIAVLERIICQLTSLEHLLEQNYPKKSPEISGRIQKAQNTRKQYEKEWFDRLNR